MRLTSNGVCGASIEPIRPKDEHRACIEFLVWVGNNSDVNTYVMLKNIEAINFPAKKKAKDSHVISGKEKKQNVIFLIHTFK